ncbi:AAA family ATPase [Vibrio sp. UCD-FRSSP16_10]|uniref:ATP-binding protein n=1 Tax=unclassified Vibrio TaxID=2614977 RepID=UPI0007FEA4F6|nr:MULTISPECIES: ATP-binding protein [unclassified Vibrio]OBT12175.1 AAA family ATPase [Vibrio sp. UCD-FRSSP16_30]OBT20506.1 AAA family ATPase [Vibrio sp. UCD-FRSSP16_10]
MRAKHFLLPLILMLLSFSAQAKWEYNLADEPQIDEVASKIAAEVDNVPEPLFMGRADKEKVNQLMEAVINEQRKHADQFATQIDTYSNSDSEKHWKEAEQTWLTLRSLGKSKEDLIKLSSHATQELVTGFGPSGVTQFKQEWYITRLNGEFLIHLQIRSFKLLMKDIFISPVPLVWAVLKVLFIYFVLTWWLANSKRFIEGFKNVQLENGTRPPLWIRLIWYISRAHRAIAVLIAITLSLRVLSTIPSLSQLIVLEIFTWWILGGSIAISFILEFAYRNSRTSSKEIISLRLSTIRWYIWSFIFVGVILQISERMVGKGTIYYWISSLVFFWFVLITLKILRKWRPIVFRRVSKASDKPLWVVWAEKNENTFLLNIGATVVGIVWIIKSTCQSIIVSKLSQYTFFSQGLAYLFKIEVAKQNETELQSQNFVRIKGDELFQYITPGHEDSTLIDYASNEFKLISSYVLSNSPAVCVISGERGIGTTTFLKQLLFKVKNATPIYLNCPYAGYTELMEEFAEKLGLNRDVGEIQILNHLRKSNENYLIALDNGQRLVKPMVGGLAGLLKFTNLLRRSKKNHRAVLAIEKASWRFVDRARGERLLFDWVSFLPNWSEAQVAMLLASRINQTDEHHVSFDGLVVPKQWDNDNISEEDRARNGFYRILWHYADGNPTVALRFFRLSLRRNKTTDAVVVRLFRAPESEELEKMPKPMLAVLRSIVQLEVASQEALSECTRLSHAEVLGTLRYFQSRGYIDWSEDKAKISDHWYRHITNVLHRQHLLVK